VIRGRVITFAAAVNEALTEAMLQDDNVICYGLGVTDPKAVFGTTSGLESRFGRSRVFDMPTSENAMTGVAIGAALGGLRPVMTHQRLDFFLLALDQLVNAAAKWHYMFGSQQSVPITIRLIVGRGWGQGPTHSQNLHAWFAHIPGLKVVMPTTPEDAKGLLLSSIFDPNPVVFIEHRWLHGGRSVVPEGDYRTPIGKARVLRTGTDITLVSMSYLAVEAMEAAKVLSRDHGIEAEVIDLRSVRPLDWQTVLSSVARTGRLLALDTGFATGSVAGEIVARASMELFDKLKERPSRLAMPDQSEPTSVALTRGFYVRAQQIVECVAEMLGRPVRLTEHDSASAAQVHDVPGPWFSGPF
jgi:pyruvate/2-oxoglutarate/acetoin dehydrogenase E1 component